MKIRKQMAQVNPEIVLFMLGFDCCLEGTGKSPMKDFALPLSNPFFAPKFFGQEVS